jgi:hypothetical protein
VDTATALIDCVGNTVAGTTLTNPATWWSLPTVNSFPGYTFQAGHRYKIRRGVWSSCVSWTEKAKIVEMRNWFRAPQVGELRGTLPSRRLSRERPRSEESRLRRSLSRHRRSLD